MSDSANDRAVLGVDIGGSGMKAALVDPIAGTRVSDRRRIRTPKPAVPTAMQTTFEELRDHFDYSGPIGCTFPGVIRAGTTVMTAANLDPSWVGVDAADLFGADHSPVTMINDGDAAGIAEMRHGAGVGVRGTVILVTIGTGLGTAVFTDGVLVANTELGHVELGGEDAEKRASSRVIDDEGLSFTDWAPRFEAYLHHIEQLFWPELFILGGGISKDFDRWSPMISIDTPVVPAALRNHAGIIGAAIVAAANRY
ncbi:MAG: ROK family protein [Actinomycetota bacterium]